MLCLFLLNILYAKEKHFVVYKNKVYHNIHILRPNLDEQTKLIYSDLINKHCPKQVRMHMVAILEQESGYRSHVINGDDWGIGQINGRTWSKVFHIRNKNILLNPIKNIEYACKILEFSYNTKGKQYPATYYSFYHSWTNKVRQKYIARIEEILKRMEF